VGTEPNATYAGGSLVIAPDGEVLAEAGSEKTALFADIDPARVRGWRERFPALRDTHRSLLGQIPLRTSADSARLD
jgi:predicted amidohydrolase